MYIMMWSEHQIQSRIIKFDDCAEVNGLAVAC